MGDDLDVEALLEAPFSSSSTVSIPVQQQQVPPPQQSLPQTSGNGNTNGDGSRIEEEREDKERNNRDNRDRSSRRDDRRHRDDDDRRRRRRSRSRSRSRDRRRRSRSPRRRSRSPRGDRRDGRRDNRRDGGGGGGGRRERDDGKSERQREREREREKRRKEESAMPVADREVLEMERDIRTIFVINLPTRANEDEIADFFEDKAGKVRDVRLIMDRNSRRSKGLGYIEFYDKEGVQAALGLSGLSWNGTIIQVQASQAEKNRAALSAATQASLGPTRLYVGNLHSDVIERDLKSVFEPFGEIEFVDLHKEPDGKSKGFAFVQYRKAEDAKKALSKLNGINLAGRQIKVGLVNDRENSGGTMSSFGGFGTLGELDDDEGGVALKPHDRALLMAKLQRSGGENSAIPGIHYPHPPPVQGPPPSVCMLLKNMFDPSTETDPNFHIEIAEDVKDECEKHGPVLHIFVDKNSDGFVYLKFASVASCTAAIAALNKRWFSGQQISAEYLPESIYYIKFPEAKY